MNPHAPRPPAPFAPPPPPGPDGVLLVDKAGGPTSHDVVASVRRRFRLRKVGHGGTLDPQATGLLVLLLGRATKLSGRFLTSDKTYEGVLRLGVSTDSQDAQGQVLRESDPAAAGVTAERLAAEMAQRTGDVYQTPPMVSAVKVEGVPLYKRARRGQTIEREARLVHVYEFKLLGYECPRARFRVKCSKGTYVRTLGSEVGDALGCGASLEALRRLESGSLRVEDAHPLETVLAWDRAELERHLLPLRRFI